MTDDGSKNADDEKSTEPGDAASGDDAAEQVTGSTADFGEIAKDCVCFANGAGGTLLIGIGTTLITALFVTRTFMELASRSSTARLRI